MRFFIGFCLVAALASCSDVGTELSNETPTNVAISEATSSPINLRVAPAFQAKNTGPNAAKGAIYYFGGHSVEAPTPEDDDIVQPYLISLNKRGWDVFRANPPIKYRQNRYRQALADSLNAVSTDARNKGYNKVILAGQSFGAWNILAASNAAQFDKFISIAPASFGTAKKYGGPSWEDDMKGMIPLAQSSRVPGVLITFKDDEFYTPRVADAVSAVSYPRVTVLDRPSGFVGHGSAWLQAFDFVYTDCFDKYLASNASSFVCKTPPIKNLIRTEQDLQRNGYPRVTDVDFARDFIGNTIAGNSFGETLNIYFPNNKTVIAEARSGYNKGQSERSSYSFESSTICAKSKLLGNGCAALYKNLRSGVYYATDEDGNILFQGEIVAGNPRRL